jgi:group I intron endonuclease
MSLGEMTMDFYKTGVYCWLNLVNSKMYIGGAYGSLHRRHRNYLSLFARGKCHNRHLQYAWDKYGEENFKFLVFRRCPASEVAAYETLYIEIFQATDSKHGYNICKDARSRLGVKHSDEARAKMSKTKKGMVGPRTGAVLSAETKAKISATKTGRKMSDESRAKMSKARMGRKMSPHHLAASRAAHWSKGPNAKKIAAKIATGNSGQVRTPKQCRNISDGRRRQLKETA